MLTYQLIAIPQGIDKKSHCTRVINLAEGRLHTLVGCPNAILKDTDKWIYGACIANLAQGLSPQPKHVPNLLSPSASMSESTAHASPKNPVCPDSS